MTPGLTSSKRKFNAPWVRRQDSGSSIPSSSEEKLQDVMSRVITQAGVDYECVLCPGL